MLINIEPILTDPNKPKRRNGDFYVSGRCEFVNKIDI